MRTLLHKPDSEGVGETFLVTFRAFESISTVTVDLIWLALTAATVTFLYKRRQAALTSRNGIPFPPGPPARWFWGNALPSVK